MKRTDEEKEAARTRRWAKAQGIESVERIGKTNQVIVQYADREVGDVFDYSSLIAEGLVDEDLKLTDKGELKLHQLKIKKWIAENRVLGEDGKLHKKERNHVG